MIPSEREGPHRHSDRRCGDLLIYRIQRCHEYIFTEPSGIWGDSFPSSPFVTHLMFVLDPTILTFAVAGEDSQIFAGTAGAAAILAKTAVYYTLCSKDKEHDFPKLPGIQFFHAWKFFKQRYDFLHSNVKQNVSKSFSFNVLHHNVVALGGEDARRAFFSNPHLNLSEGYKVLKGAVHVSPATSECSIDLDDARHPGSAM
jgi:hypothetical protein